MHNKTVAPKPTGIIILLPGEVDDLTLFGLWCLVEELGLSCALSAARADPRKDRLTDLLLEVIVRLLLLVQLLLCEVVLVVGRRRWSHQTAL